MLHIYYWQSDKKYIFLSIVIFAWILFPCFRVHWLCERDQFAVCSFGTFAAIASFCYSAAVCARLFSCFGIHGTALNWFISHLSSRCFHAKCNDDFFPTYFPMWCPQGSLLGPLLFVMYATPLSNLVSFLSLNHDLYPNDTQLFLSIHLSDFHSNIIHLQNAQQQISSCMTANLFSINSSKNEFIIIGLKQQLSKYTTVLSLNPHRSQPLFYFWRNTLPTLNKLLHYCYYHIRDISVSAYTLTSKQPAPLPPPSFIQN